MLRECKFESILDHRMISALIFGHFPWINLSPSHITRFNVLNYAHAQYLHRCTSPYGEDIRRRHIRNVSPAVYGTTRRWCTAARENIRHGEKIRHPLDPSNTLWMSLRWRWILADILAVQCWISWHTQALWGFSSWHALRNQEIRLSCRNEI